MDSQNRTMVRQTRTKATEFRTSGDSANPRIEGYFVVFDDTYDMGYGVTESVDPHAFDKCIHDDIRCLTDHDTRLVLGRTTAGTLRLRVDEHGLFGSVDINTNDTDAMNLYARVQRGDVSQCSFGFDILKEDAEFRDNGSQHFIIREVKLYEVSCCTFPAYESTSISARNDERMKEIKKRHVQAWAAEMKGRIEKWH